MQRVDLNSDMGESFGLYRYGEDDAIVKSITSANLACGFHAGDPTVMRDSIRLAKQHNVAIGAHPGFRDLAGFGRRYLTMKPHELKNDVAYQLGALGALARAENAAIHHVKPHGALYMMALEDEALAQAIVDAVVEFDDGLMIYTVHDSALDAAGRRAGLRIVPEFFADRPYFADGTVKMFDWTLDEVGDTATRILNLVTEGAIASLDGDEIRPTFETVCVHSDTPGSAAIAAGIREALSNASVAVEAP